MWFPRESIEYTCETVGFVSNFFSFFFYIFILISAVLRVFAVEEWEASRAGRRVESLWGSGSYADPSLMRYLSNISFLSAILTPNHSAGGNQNEAQAKPQEAGKENI